MAESIESFLAGPPRVVIVGGSPLYTPTPGVLADAISINGFHAGAYAAAINQSSADRLRVKNWPRVLMPRSVAGHDPSGIMVPSRLYAMPDEMPSKVQPTTCFALLLICYSLGLEVELYGVCGRASKWHDGDWEMHWIKTRMPNVKVFDPRPAW